MKNCIKKLILPLIINLFSLSEVFPASLNEFQNVFVELAGSFQYPKNPALFSVAVDQHFRRLYWNGEELFNAHNCKTLVPLCLYEQLLRFDVPTFNENYGRKTTQDFSLLHQIKRYGSGPICDKLLLLLILLYSKIDLSYPQYCLNLMSLRSLVSSEFLHHGLTKTPCDECLKVKTIPIEERINNCISRQLVFITGELANALAVMGLARSANLAQNSLRLLDDFQDFLIWITVPNKELDAQTGSLLNTFINPYLEAQDVNGFVHFFYQPVGAQSCILDLVKLRNYYPNLSYLVQTLYALHLPFQGHCQTVDQLLVVIYHYYHSNLEQMTCHLMRFFQMMQQELPDPTELNMTNILLHVQTMLNHLVEGVKSYRPAHKLLLMPPQPMRYGPTPDETSSIGSPGLTRASIEPSP